MTTHDSGSARARLINFHVRANTGVFFSRVVDLGGGLHYAMGASGIDDFYWNYGYLSTGEDPSLQQLTVLREHASAHSLTPTSWSISPISPSSVTPSWELMSTESWMTRDLANAPAKAESDKGVEIQVLDQPDEEMCKVFTQAYGEESDDDAGYSGLPPAYTEAYMAQLPEWPTRALHTKITYQGRCCAIASALLRDDIVGIYSVGTSPNARRRGFGSLATEAALEAAQTGSQGVVRTAVLQTEADSVVETMYAKMGFQRQFLGALRVEPRDA